MDSAPYSCDRPTTPFDEMFWDSVGKGMMADCAPTYAVQNVELNTYSTHMTYIDIHLVLEHDL